MRSTPESNPSVRDLEVSNLGENLIQRFQDKLHKAALRVTGGSFLCELAAFRDTQRRDIKMGIEIIQMIMSLREEKKANIHSHTANNISHSRLGVEINVTPQPL